MRLQLALNVRKLDEAIEYYSKLFNASPHKIRAGYANFSIENPPLKLVLFEKPEAEERVNHLGVEVFNVNELEKASRRLQASGMVNRIETDETCCHATQDKVWSQEPQGLHWEWYRIKDDNPENASNTADTCCATSSCG